MNLLKICTNSLNFFILTIIAHIFLCQIINKNNFLLKSFGLGVIASLIYVSCIFLKPNFNLIGLYIYITLWTAYLAGFINLLNSITLKMLENLYLNPTENTQTKIAKKSFNSKKGFESRLLLLEKNNFIRRKNNQVNLTIKAKWLLKIILIIKFILSVD